MAISMDDYKDDFSGTGVENTEPVKPEDEFFHSIYIGHSPRKNHINVLEEQGKFHIRGVQYNLDQVNMIITLTKKILVKTVEDINKKEKVDCFSFQDGPLPYKGIKGQICGLNANERALNPFCAPCRAQIIVAGILCDENGNPWRTEDNKPVFGFLRGKGMRYSGVSNHLNELIKMDLEPIVKPVTEESKKWEKKHINQSRVVTKITRDLATTQYKSSVNIFKFEIGQVLPEQAVEKIVKIAKETVEQFKEKFDWSKSQAAQIAANSGPSQAQTFGVPNEKQKEETSGITTEDIPFGDDKPEDTTPQVQGNADISYEDLQF